MNRHDTLSTRFRKIMNEDQCRIYIEAKEAVLGDPRTQGAPKFIKENLNGCKITITRNMFNQILIKLLI